MITIPATEDFTVTWPDPGMSEAPWVGDRMHFPGPTVQLAQNIGGEFHEQVLSAPTLFANGYQFSIPPTIPEIPDEVLREGLKIWHNSYAPMSKLRGVASFTSLWRRRTTLTLPDGFSFDLMALPDLVQAKKTQRDKDWPMIRRLVEAHYFEHRGRATAARVRFWLRELRTPELFVGVAGHWPADLATQKRHRRLLASVRTGNEGRLAQARAREEWDERRKDAAYWRPLKAEIERLRHRRLKGEGPPIPPTA